LNEFEVDLRDMLQSRAGDVTTQPQMHETLRRTKVRRVTNVGFATLCLIVIVGVAVVAVQAFLVPTQRRTEEILRPAVTTDGPYGFTSVTGEYPVVATGEFNGATWELTGTTVAEGEADHVDLKLTISRDGSSVIDEVRVDATDDVMLNRYVEATDMLDGAHVVYGATVPGVDSVEVAVADGSETVIPVHRFTDYDSQGTIRADYFLAFVPGDAPGFVHARDELGTDMDLEAYGRVSLAPHVVATGKVGDAAWSFEFAGGLVKDRFCIVFAPVAGGSDCFTRTELEEAGPILLATFESDDVSVVVGIIRDDVGPVQLVREGMDPADLRWFSPPDEDRADWPLRFVAVGLPPGTHGAIQAYAGDGETQLEEERF
jgi:hypothetical protein